MIHNLAVSIMRMVDHNQPGQVECVFSDVTGRKHKVIDKAPIFHEELLDAASQYPLDGYLRCEVLATWRDGQGTEIKRISTARPDDIESTENLSEFVVFADQIST